MVPWSIKRVTDLPLSAKLREMQQNMHGLVQLIKAATPDVPNETPMPQLRIWTSPFQVGDMEWPLFSGDMDWPLSGWGYGPAHFQLGIWSGPFPVGDMV